MEGFYSIRDSSVEVYLTPCAILWTFCRTNCRLQFQKRSQTCVQPPSS